LEEVAEGGLVGLIQLTPRPNYLKSLGHSLRIFPSGTKKPHKSMIYRASSIKMAADVGIEATTH